jgi:hypothetical protein
MAMWEIDFYRRTQQPDGSVAGGMLFGDGPSGDGGNSASWLNRHQVALYAADHPANYAAALLFAKAALTFKAYGFTGAGSLTDAYTTAAVSAFNWAEGLYKNLTAEDAYYNGVLGLSTYITNNTGSQGESKFSQGSTTVQVPTTSGWSAGTVFAVASDPFQIFTVAAAIDGTHVAATVAPSFSGSGSTYKCGWTTAQFNTAMAAIDASGTGPNGGDAYQSRYAACGALYRLTGNLSYAKQITSDANPPGTAAWKMIGQWEYINGPGRINPAVLSNFNGNLRYEAALKIIEGRQAYLQGSSGKGSIGYGPGDGGDFLLSCGPWQHVNYPGSTVYSNATLKRRWRRIWQATANLCHGANQYGNCWVTGLGSRNVNYGMVLRDREAQGKDVPVMPQGYIPYAVFGNVGGPGGFANLKAGGGPSNFNTTQPVNESLGIFPNSNNPGKVIDANNFDTPQWENSLENSFVIFNMEYTTEQNMIPKQVSMHFLNGWDGN